MAQLSADARALPPDLQPLRANDPRHLGPYVILGRLGAGGMGVAYLGESDRERVVVKVLSSAANLDHGTIVRLQRELEAMGRAASDRTVQLRQHDLEHDPPWFAMEFVPGPTLQNAVASTGPLSPVSVHTLAYELALAIADIHRAGVIHRDLKPSNIILSPSHARIIDFGVAATEGGTMLTKTGQIMGTMGWLAPEQIAEDEFSEATDVHAWGLCIYFAATGANPYDAATPGASMFRIVHEDPEPPRGLPPSLTALIQGALAKSPAARPTLDDIEAALQKDDTATTPTTPIPAPRQKRHSSRHRLLVASVAAVILGSGLGFVFATLVL